MARALVLAAATVGSWATVSWAEGAAGVNEPPQIAAFVRQLGDKSYLVRQRATKALAAIGPPAKQELLAVLSHPDAEVRFRARRLLTAVLERDFQLQLDAFVKGEKVDAAEVLPGWDRFREFAGDEPASRRLFAEMQRSERDLLRAAFANPAGAGEFLQARCQHLQTSMQAPNASTLQQAPLGSVAAFLFVGGLSDVPISTQAGSHVNNFSYQQPFQEAMLGSQQSLLRKLLAGWIGRDFSLDSMVAYQSLMLALRYEVREGLDQALSVIRAPGAPAHMRQFAVLAIGKLGSREHLATLQPLLADETVCMSQEIDGKEVETQLRDVALAVMVHICGQPLRDFGFQTAQANPILLFNTATLGFSKASDRDAALARWRSWLNEHPQGAVIPGS